MLNRIKYTPIADIVDYFKEICTLSRPIEGTPLVTHIALNIGCPELLKVDYIEGGVPIIGLSHFVHAHVLCEEPNHSISMLYEGRNKVLLLHWTMRIIASQDHHMLAGVPGGKQQNTLPLTPSGTLGTGVAFWGIRKVVVHTIITVPLGQATESEHPPLPSSPTGTNPREVYQLWGGPSRTSG
jgi:hypothetical protein